MNDWLTELIHKFKTPRFQDLTPNEMWNLPYSNKTPKGLRYVEAGGYRGNGPQFRIAIGDSIDNQGNNWVVKYTRDYWPGLLHGFQRDAINQKTGEKQSRFVEAEPSENIKTAPAESFTTWGDKSYLDFFKKGGGIHIKKKNRGKFTDYCGGTVTEECIQRGKHSSNPTTRKRANFAWVARHKFKHQTGGELINPTKGAFFSRTKVEIPEQKKYTTYIPE